MLWLRAARLLTPRGRANAGPTALPRLPHHGRAAATLPGPVESGPGQPWNAVIGHAGVVALATAVTGMFTPTEAEVSSA